MPLVTTNRYATYKTGVFVENNLTKIAAQNIRNSIVNDLVELRRRCVEKEPSKKEDEEEKEFDPLMCEGL
jgi:hypothetical protein